MAYRHKLIELALPLEGINREATLEGSIRHGHPSRLHLSWAGCPLAACRAVLFSPLVDDPTECVAELMADSAKWKAVERALAAQRRAWDARKAQLESTAAAGRESKLGYRLYTVCDRRKWSQDAIGYNALVLAWPDLKRWRANRSRRDRTSGS